MRIALFSGGHDSTAATHVSRGEVDCAAHIVTGTGIPATTTYVEERCADWGIPLVKLETPPEVYEQWVMRGPGFPGPSAHQSVYYYLKQQRLRELRRRFGDVVFVTGIRRSESDRRMRRKLAVPERREGRITWRNPILDWTATDVSRYLADEGIPRNPVVDLLHRSGECLCGAFAKRAELVELRLWFPEVAERIDALEARARSAGLTNCYWGGQTASHIPTYNPDQLCWTCEVEQ